MTIYLAGFDVILPDPGLVFWTSIVFLIVWFLIGRFAFRPIQKALRDREDTIQNALDEAKRAREEMQSLQAKNEELLVEAQEERTKILQEAKTMKESIVNEAKDKAKAEAQKIVLNAKQEIENQKQAALIDVKNKAGLMALEIAEKVLRKELQSDKAQQDFVNGLAEEIKLN